MINAFRSSSVFSFLFLFFWLVDVDVGVDVVVLTCAEKKLWASVPLCHHFRTLELLRTVWMAQG